MSEDPSSEGVETQDQGEHDSGATIVIERKFRKREKAGVAVAERS